MRKAQRWIPMLAVIMWMPGLSAAKSEKTTVGKKGTVVLKTETRVSDLVLEPGRYRFQHHEEGTEHFLEFTGLSRNGGNMRGVGGIARCQVQHLSAKAPQTELSTSRRHGIDRITRIEVKGETVAHLF